MIVFNTQCFLDNASIVFSCCVPLCKCLQRQIQLFPPIFIHLTLSDLNFVGRNVSHNKPLILVQIKCCFFPINNVYMSGCAFWYRGRPRGQHESTWQHVQDHASNLVTLTKAMYSSANFNLLPLLLNSIVRVIIYITNRKCVFFCFYCVSLSPDNITLIHLIKLIMYSCK